jgi:hypothetical protein
MYYKKENGDSSQFWATMNLVSPWFVLGLILLQIKHINHPFILICAFECVFDFNLRDSSSSHPIVHAHPSCSNVRNYKTNPKIYKFFLAH